MLLDLKRSALYGTTQSGGVGYGNVYQIIPPADESVLYTFCSQPNCADGFAPVASLIEDNAGNLYGMTEYGGADNLGVVFEIIRSQPRSFAVEDSSPHTILPAVKK